jgi:hypothetical protein
VGDPFPPTPEGFRLRMKGTLDGLREEPKKRRHKIGAAVLVAAVLLTLLIGTALAAGYFSGEIDWTGRRVAENAPDEPEITMAPTEAAEAEALDARRDEIFTAQPEGEYWIIENGDGTSNGRDCEKTFDSLGALNAFLQAGDTDFRLVTEAPEGFSFSEAYCTFYFTKEIVETATVTRADVGDGMTLVRIKPGDGYLPLVASYRVDFRNATGDRVCISANYTNCAPKDWSFGVYEDDVYESLRIDGMLHALYFDKGEYRKVYMIEKTAKAKGYQDFFYMDSILNGEDDGVTFKYISYNIRGSSLPRASLISLAESLK